MVYIYLCLVGAYGKCCLAKYTMTMEPMGLAMSCAANSSETLMCFLVQVRIMRFLGHFFGCLYPRNPGMS